MQFKIRKRHVDTNLRYSKQDIETARKFFKRIYKELGVLVKSVVVYGSAAKKTGHKKPHDIDVLIIIDDVQIYMTKAVMETYKILVNKVVANVSKKLHVNTLRFSAFWEYVRNGDPVAINMLRDSYILYDTNFFEPMKILLKQGRVRPTEEAIWNYYSRSPMTLTNSKWHLLQATIDLYWAVTDSAHAVLMKAGVTPPSPDHIADLLEERFVKTKILEKKYSALMRKFYSLMKMIVHRELKEITGQQFDVYYKEAYEFVDRMRQILEFK